MGADSKIEWTDHTFNPWIGCTKVSPGCTHCYAETLDRNRFSKTLGGATKANPIPHWGKGAPRQRTSASNWDMPRRWNRAAEKEMADFLDLRDKTKESPIVQEFLAPMGDLPRRPRVFCASLADWLDDEVPVEWLVDLLQLIQECRHLDWQLLTKRPENWRERLEAAEKNAAERGLLAVASFIAAWLTGSKPAMIWIGTTVEDQDNAGDRHRLLMDIPARVHFWSVEPMLTAINAREAWAKYLKPDWVICGGESGKDARPMNPDWARSLRTQCATRGVPFFFKQWGEWVRDSDIWHKAIMEGVDVESRIVPYGDGDDTNFRRVYRVGKIRAGRLLDGVEHNAFPE